MAKIYQLVVLEPGDEIKIENIHAILGKESPVFYSDGETKLGVFFDTAHRQYVSYSDIPKNFVNAMVASEDNRFFTHIGFDIVGIMRAMIKNLEAGKVVQGGSTLTQQTAKNLFKRTDRSFASKLKELLFALRLEYYYPKETIFEFYANQFYVSGNGHGLGIAARYYFDKLPSELTLVECAFIAGSVKQPNYYNPFIKKTEQAAELARERAQARTRYVLDKMRDLGMIDIFTYKETIKQKIDFKNGKVGYDLDYAMELVRDAVSSTEVLEGLEAHDITNIASSGVRVITTIDRELQESTLAALRRELSLLDVRLRGFDHEDVQTELAAVDYSGDSALRKDAFLFGRIDEITGKGEDLRIAVTLDKDLGAGVIDAQGLEGLTAARRQWLEGRMSKSKKGDQANLVEQLQVGDRVWVSVREANENDQTALLDLYKFPEIQGGALVIRNGAIKAMAGGTENRFFNRAIQAKRQMGSALKPLVYTAALQLGWNSADILKNSRSVFTYHNQAYFPRPDHHSPYDWVSMSWAGVHSENVASVWLLSHLCDKLNPFQLAEVAGRVGLAPQIIDGVEEPYRSYRTRIRDKYGILVTRDVLRAAAYRLAVENLETDFIFDGMMSDYEVLKDLPYGLNYQNYAQDINTERKRGGAGLSRSEQNELWLRQSLLSQYYLRLEPLRKELATYRSLIEPALNGGTIDFSNSTGGAAIYLDRRTGEYSFMRQQGDKTNLVKMNDGELRDHLTWLDYGENSQFWENIKLDGLLTVGAFDRVAEQMDHEYQKLSDELPYSMEVLSQVDDFRTTVGLYYLIRLSEQLGINSSLDPVLSFPLGSNVITLLEATRMYEGLVTGKVGIFGDPKKVQDEEGSNDSLAILDRIESADGEILYQPKVVHKQVVDDKTRLAVGSILENVVKFGTGRAAIKNVKLQAGAQVKGAKPGEMNLTVPVLGKTGTANNYTNASFFGYLPGIAENGVAMTLHDGYAVGVYVGFDDNESMRRKSSRISGAAGALPTWCDIVNELLKEQHYADKLDPVDLSFNGLIIKRDDLGQMNIGVDEKNGGRLIEPVVPVSESSRMQPSIETFGKTTDTGRFIMERNFQPFWKNTADGGK